MAKQVEARPLGLSPRTPSNWFICVRLRYVDQSRTHLNQSRQFLNLKSNEGRKGKEKFLQKSMQAILT